MSIIERCFQIVAYEIPDVIKLEYIPFIVIWNSWLIDKALLYLQSETNECAPLETCGKLQYKGFILYPLEYLTIYFKVKLKIILIVVRRLN